MTPEAFNDAYFRRLYGDLPQQSRWDRGRDARIVKLVEEHDDTSGGSLLDVGCGYGYLLARFRDRYRTFGVEVSGHAGPLARRQAGAQVAVADLQVGLPFRDAAFDVVVAVNVVEHLPDPEAGVRAILRVLRPGGLCIVHLPTISGPVSGLLYRLFYASDPTHVYRPSSRQVRALFEAHGFRTLRHSHAPHAPGWLWRAVTWNPAYLAVFRLVP